MFPYSLRANQDTFPQGELKALIPAISVYSMGHISEFSAIWGYCIFYKLSKLYYRIIEQRHPPGDAKLVKGPPSCEGGPFAFVPGKDRFNSFFSPPPS